MSYFKVAEEFSRFPRGLTKEDGPRSAECMVEFIRQNKDLDCTIDLSGILGILAWNYQQYLTKHLPNIRFSRG